jgi:hypothetical protein
MTKSKFLSDEWLARVKELADSMGDLKIPPKLSALIWNITVEMADGTQRELSMQRMVFRAGASPEGLMTMFMDEVLARKLFIDGDTQAGLFAFMSGDMRIEGDVSMITVLQSEQPSAEMGVLGEKIKELTAD